MAGALTVSLAAAAAFIVADVAAATFTKAAKQAVDPQGILNPGVLLDPVNRVVGRTGALAAPRGSSGTAG